MEIFNSALPWFKGNLHMHTTLSDGNLSPEEAVGIYKAHGYDFVAITDHGKFFPETYMDGVLVLSGTELDIEPKEPRLCYHVTGVGIQQPVSNTCSTPQQMIDRIHEAGGFATLAHPVWSLMTHESVAALHDFDAIEIYNAVSEFYSGRGYSDGYIDVLAAAGRTTRITAVDDVHFYQKEACVGFIMVNAAENTSAAILQAIRENRFYASQGPAFQQISLQEDGSITVKTSDVAQILFMSDSFYNPNRVHYPAQGEDTLCSATYAPGKNDTCVRVELIDKNGRHAWSNFLPLK